MNRSALTETASRLSALRGDPARAPSAEGEPVDRAEVRTGRRDLIARIGAWGYARMLLLQHLATRRRMLAAAMLLVAPTVFTGLAFDDYLFGYFASRPARDEWAARSPFDLFRWVDAAHRTRLVDGQGLPWWSYEHTQVAFMRPLTSLTHALDLTLWPHSAFAMHLHSVLWFGLLLLVAARAYGELEHEPIVAGVATTMFAFDSSHGAAVGWISSRNALLGGVFGIAAVLLHHRWRARRERSWAALAGCCFALSVLSTEAGIGTAGYLMAYALIYERGAPRARAASLLPYLALAVGWLSLRRLAHYAVVGLGGYVDPISAPLAFLRVLPARAFALIAAQTLRVNADWFELAPLGLRPLVLLNAIACCALVVWGLWPALRADRTARFWALGAVLSALPLTAAIPSDRLLTLVGLGAMPALARMMVDTLRAVAASGGPLGFAALARRNLAVGLVCTHLVCAPFVLPVFALAPAWFARGASELEASLPTTPELRGQTVIVAAVPRSWQLSYLPAMRSLDGKPRPAKLHWLLASEHGARFERVGPDQLRVTAEEGLFDAHWFERNQLHPMRRGDRVELSELTAIVREVSADGRPLVCDFVFAGPLESSRYRWLTYRDGRLVPFALPALGKPVTLPNAS